MLPRLEELELYASALPDEDMEHVAALTHLRTLRLVGGYGVTGEGLKQLVKLPNLQLVVFGKNNVHHQALPGEITRDDIEAVAKQMPRCTFVFYDNGNRIFHSVGQAASDPLDGPSS